MTCSARHRRRDRRRLSATGNVTWSTSGTAVGVAKPQLPAQSSLLGFSGRSAGSTEPMARCRGRPHPEGGFEKRGHCARRARLSDNPSVATGRWNRT